MKKINKMKIALLKGFLLTGIILTGLLGCTNNVSNPEKQEKNIETEKENKNVGKAKFTIFVPDYQALSKQVSERAIASQTEKIRLSYYNDSTSAWVLHGTLGLGQLQSAYVEGLNDRVPGNLYDAQFDNIPSGSYPAGKLKIELVDASDQVITKGTNDSDVIILMGETSTATFYTLPENDSNDKGDLKAGEMKFYKLDVVKGRTYTVTVSVSENDTRYPDIAIFDEKGRYVSYHSISASKPSVTFEKETENTFRYIGIYAADFYAIEHYALSITTSGTIAGAVNYDTFNQTGFGTGGSLDSSFTASTTAGSSYKSYVCPKITSCSDYDGDSTAVVFGYQYLQTNTASLTRKVILNENAILSFAYKTDITSLYDGTLNFYVDNELQASYTGKNGSWTNVSFLVPEGEHQIEWRSVGASASYATGITNSVYIDAVNLAIAPEPDYTLQNGFGTSSTFTYDWTLSGEVQPVLEENADADGDGYAVKFNYKSLKTGTSSLSRTVRVDSDSIITFKYKTDIYYEFDGVMNFYIDDVLQDSSWSGIGGNWTTVQYSIDAGSHKVEWRAVGVDDGWTNATTTWTVYLGDLGIIEAPKAPATLSQDFSSELDPLLWVPGGVSSCVSNDEIYSAWVQYGKALVDTHTKVYKLATRNENSVSGTSTLQIFEVKPTVDSSLSFDYKLDLFAEDYFRVYVDGVKKFEATGYGQTWRTASVDIPAGKHTILFSTEKTTTRYSTTFKNLAYIDNVSLVADETVSVDISPKGKQETYINGFNIQFTANALRSDGTARSGRTVTWSSTGGSIDQNGLFTPTTPGTYTVTATIDGVQASNNTVVVHGEDYLEDSVTLNGETFTGYAGATGTKSTGTVNFTKAPVATTFSADGFFVLKGTVNNSNTRNYAMVSVSCGSYDTFVLLHDDFYTRVWLRFGEGPYTINIYDMTSISFDGDQYTGGGFSSANTITYTVTNTHPIENAMQLMPSYYCQGDDFIVSNVVNNVVASLPENATTGQKMQALHDWQIHLLHYDNVSLKSYRKKQDAVTVVKNTMGVCEGYANLYASLVRSIGVRTKYQSSSSMNHGWVQCYYDGQWRLVDITWDDPVASQSLDYVEKNPYAENYKYFLIGTTGVNNDHYSDTTETRRAALVNEVRNPEFRLVGLPGWY